MRPAWRGKEGGEGLKSVGEWGGAEPIQRAYVAGGGPSDRRSFLLPVDVHVSTQPFTCLRMELDLDNGPLPSFDHGLTTD